MDLERSADLHILFGNTGTNLIYCMVLGPVLVKQEKSEAINNVQKRIEFINTEMYDDDCECDMI